MKKIALLIALILVVPITMFAQKFKWNNNQVIAHRGAWKKNNLPENSIASLKEAIRIGCYGSEFDVHLTADSVLVVNHDPEFKGLKIETATYQQLLEKEHTNGEKIPTLAGYLKEGMKQKKTKLILEMKISVIDKARTLTLARKCVEMVKNLKAEAWVDYISFDYDALKEVKMLDKKANVSYLNGDVAAEKLKADGFAGVDYHYSVYQKDETWFTKTKALGLTLNAWTVNTEKEMLWLLANKADFITTNEPEMLFELLNK